MSRLVLLAGGCALTGFAQAPAPLPSPPAVDMATLPRPVAMLDTVWIEEMTQLEVRDSLRAGKTTVLIPAGGMEDNGPYVAVSQHNSIVRAMAERIARQLGNALCAPAIALAPANPAAATNPGSVVLSAATYKSVLTDMATSLRAQGFRHIMILADHGPDQAPAIEVVNALNAAWKGQGATVAYVSDYYDYDAVAAYSRDVLGNPETPEGYHDDYYVAAISAVIDAESIRLPERKAAGRTAINGIDLATAKALEDGQKIIDLRVAAAVKQIRSLIGTGR